MIWLALTALTCVCLAPLGWPSWRRGMRGRRTAAIDLHRAQLAELDRDLAQERIGLAEHAVARLEVQRRLLAEAALQERQERSTTLPLILTVAAIPMAALLLYLPGSAPQMPAAPLAGRVAEARRQAAEVAGLMAQLRARIAALDPHSDQARRGYVLLGNLDDTAGDLPAAADAWEQALQIGFDAQLAAQVAEARSRIEGRVSPASALLFRRALAAAPADAPWRATVEQRLAGVKPAS